MCVYRLFGLFPATLQVAIDFMLLNGVVGEHISGLLSIPVKALIPLRGIAGQRSLDLLVQVSRTRFPHSMAAPLGLVPSRRTKDDFANPLAI